MDRYEMAEFIYRLRREKGLTQKELAELLGVTNKAVSKWETGAAFPELPLLQRLANLLGVTSDELMNGERSRDACASPPQETRIVTETPKRTHYEYKSRRTLFGLPLVHVNLDWGKNLTCKAKGIIAVGNISFGLLSVGFISFGFLSVGFLALGLLAIASGAFGALFAVGGIAAGGLLAVGGVAAGTFAVGGVSFGAYALGGAAFAARVAVGGYASGTVAIGKVTAGAYTLAVPAFRADVESALRIAFPDLSGFVFRLITGLFPA